MADHQASNGRLKLNNTTYDMAKDAVQIWLPGLATFYFAIATIWGFDPNPDKVVGTITALILLLGAILKVSTSSYNNGKLDNPDNQKL